MKKTGPLLLSILILAVLSCTSQDTSASRPQKQEAYSLSKRSDGSWQIQHDSPYYRYFNSVHESFSLLIDAAQSPDEHRRLHIQRDLAVARERLKHLADQQLVREVIGRTRSVSGTNETGQIFRTNDIDAIPRQRFSPSQPESWEYQERRVLGGSRGADAMTAIVQFDRQLKSRGVQLIVLPVPNSAQVFAHLLHDGISIEQEVWHPWSQMIVKLLEHDVEVIDLLDLYKTWSGDNTVLNYIDHHWGLAGLEIVGHELSRRLSRFEFDPAFYINPSELKRRDIHVPMPALIPYWDKISESYVKNRMGIGDRYQTREITLNGKQIDPVQSPTQSPVLIMGDSFLPHMAEYSAGIYAQLAWHTHIIPAAISRDAGAAKPPEWYRNQVAGRGREPAVVIWQIYGSAMIEINDLNDWKVVSMPDTQKDIEERLGQDPWAAASLWLPSSSPSTRSTARPAREKSHQREIHRVVAQVLNATAIPSKENLQTYPDALYSLQIKVLESQHPGIASGSTVLVHTRFLDDYRLLEERILTAGDRAEFYLERLNEEHEANPASATMQLLDSLDDWESEVYFAHHLLRKD